MKKQKHLHLDLTACTSYSTKRDKSKHYPDCVWKQCPECTEMCNTMRNQCIESAYIWFVWSDCLHEFAYWIIRQKTFPEFSGLK